MCLSAHRATLSPMPSRFAKPRRRPPTPQELPVQDQYLTDGRGLFRVVSRFSPGIGLEVALLEDCATLEVTPYSPDELYDMGLRPVLRPDGSV
jgi:hypothetical protein